CGYGTLALTLAKKYGLKATLVDVNSRALDLAKKNADKNNIKVDNIFLSNIYDNVEQSFDAIISNPPIRAGKEVVHAILSDAYMHLNDN
ncbi:MAG TPA: 16S rRNA methyltransferase, partial [Lactococcus sp.]|nr:16S rRNA methyltransferase [Lactococcus sp.]